MSHNSRPGNSSLSSPSRVGFPEQTPFFVVILYIFLFAILGAQISDAHKVHSRFGLAFTGIVQLVCSAVMSFSVLVLLGWNGWGSSLQEPALPTYILPFVIVVVGVENMSTLVCGFLYPSSVAKPSGSDKSCIFDTFHLLCACANRPGSEQSRHQDCAELFNRPRLPWGYLALHQCSARSRVLPLRCGSHHYRLVHAAYLFSHSEFHWRLRSDD